MKYARIVTSLLLACLASMALAKESFDSLLVVRIFSYQRNYTTDVGGFSSNFYSKFLYQTEQRNATLWLIPHMYTIAKGQRTFLSEQYGRLHFYELGDYEHENQAYYTTIPRNRRTMPVLRELLTPSLYTVLIYGDHVLSPFNRENRRYYHYSATSLGNGRARLYFRPRFRRNTQLITGVATIDIETGRIIEVSFEGEYDMIKFQTIATMGTEGARSLLPRYCHSDISFRFMGNRINSSFEAVYDCPVRLPDTLDVKGDRALIDSVRPISLSEQEQAVYDLYDLAHAPDMTVEKMAIADTLTAEAKDEDPEEKSHNYLKDIRWDLIGETLVRSFRTETDKYYVRLSPILEPQYISYSGSKGLSYKMKFSAEYYFTPSSGIYFNPTFGYNFKQRQFYLNAPLRYLYNSRNNSFLELFWRVGDRIGSSTVLDAIMAENPDLPEEAYPSNLDLFHNEELRLYNNVQLTPQLSLEAGLVYYRRTSMNPDGMRQYGKPTVYKSLAPSIGIKLRPIEKGPMFSLDYDRGLKVRDMTADYERWEADASVKHHMSSLRTLNLRLGGGLYTHRANNYFTDFSNFRDNNLPEGWNDDWTGNFQLLDSRLYNESQYYVRTNVSYESPLLIVAFLPFAGHYVEQERFYWSGLLIEHSRPYSELGYGFTSRYFSMGLFASFLNTRFQRFGTKFTFELFRRW